MKTKIVKVEVDSDGRLDFPELEDVAGCLSSGGIVAFPTETVYGLGVNAAMPEAVDRLRRLKNRPDEKPFTIHIASREAMNEHVAVVPARAERLIRRFWPGPLTLILPDGAGGRAGLRWPANKIAERIIETAGVPVAAPSANVSGEEPAWNAELVADVFSGKVEFIVDGGPAQVRQSSTVVEFDGNSPRVVREGIITSEMIEHTTNTTILLVCGGNSCRSPMAEVICIRILAEIYGTDDEGLSDYGFRIVSAGTAALDGGRPSSQAVQALANMGYPAPASVSAGLTAEMINRADYIFAMTGDQKRKILSLQPDAGLKVETLDPDGNDVADPIGGSVAVYEECARLISSFLKKRLEKL